MTYYLCIGKNNYYPSRVPNGKFVDYFEFFVGTSRTAEEIGVSGPIYPSQFVDSQGRIWVRKEGNIYNGPIQKNLQLNNWEYKPRNVEKTSLNDNGYLFGFQQGKRY